MKRRPLLIAKKKVKKAKKVTIKRTMRRQNCLNATSMLPIPVA